MGEAIIIINYNTVGFLLLFIIGSSGDLLLQSPTGGHRPSGPRGLRLISIAVDVAHSQTKASAHMPRPNACFLL